MRGTISLWASVLIALSVTVADKTDVNSVEERGLVAIDIPDYEVLDFPAWPVNTYRSNRKSQKKKKQKQKPPVEQSTQVQQQKPQAEEEQPGTPCTCKSGQCLCCTGPILDLIRQKACMKIRYTPEDFAFEYSMLLNNRVMYQNRVSGKNPPPACFSIPRFVSLRICAKFSNIYFAGRNLHMCMGMEGHWDYFELFSISFDCFRMGTGGISILKPEDGGGFGQNGGLDAVIDAGDDIEDYDENVVRSAISNIGFKNNTIISMRT